jgi:hypothetical protein
MRADHDRPGGSGDTELPSVLVEYADRLLASTGLGAHDAVRIASALQDPPAELHELERALPAGWAPDPEVQQP